MLPESRLYSFIDQNNGFTLHFLEGQKLINDLAIIHEVTAGGFQFFRDTILTFQHMITFLKPGEGLGVYIDSDEPYFRLKLELSDQGQMRTLLLPEDFKTFPDTITGNCRLVKLHPGDASPYTTLIAFDKNNPEEVVNNILTESYQVRCKIFVSNEADQSIMIMKLPNKNVDNLNPENTTSIPEYWQSLKDDTDILFQKGTFEQNEIVATFEKRGLQFLGSKQIFFKCTCSEQRMYDGIRSIIISVGIDQVFAPDEDFIETKCDYCKTVYPFKRELFLD